MSARPSLLSLRWVLTHLLVVVVAAVFIALGLWQLGRYHEVRAHQARIDARVSDEPVDLARFADLSADDHGRITALEYRRVTVTGTYQLDDQVLQRSRSHEGRNGWHLLTPLKIAEGRAVLVRRGWIPYDAGLDGEAGERAEPPSGRVTVTGYLEISDQQPSLIGPTDPATGRLDTVFHADVSRIDQQTDLSLYPMVVHLQAQQPPISGRLPIPADVPQLNSTQNLSYAIQWFSFAAIAVIGYGLFIRRHLRDRHGPEQGETAGGSPSTPAHHGRRTAPSRR